MGATEPHNSVAAWPISSSPTSDRGWPPSTRAATGAGRRRRKAGCSPIRYSAGAGQQLLDRLLHDDRPAGSPVRAGSRCRFGDRDCGGQREPPRGSMYRITCRFSRSAPSTGPAGQCRPVLIDLWTNGRYPVQRVQYRMVCASVAVPSVRCRWPARMGEARQVPVAPRGYCGLATWDYGQTRVAPLNQPLPRPLKKMVWKDPSGLVMTISSPLRKN